MSIHPATVAVFLIPGQIAYLIAKFCAADVAAPWLAVAASSAFSVWICSQPSMPGDNEYGPDPKPEAPSNPPGSD